MRMPWGKHRGQLIEDTPTGYLCWCLEETDINEPYRGAIREELAFRLHLEPPGQPLLLPPPELAPAFRDMLATGYRALALKTHPDRGGDADRMKRINAARDWCRERQLL